jgi:hypothetical protein
MGKTHIIPVTQGRRAAARSACPTTRARSRTPRASAPTTS